MKHTPHLLAMVVCGLLAQPHFGHADTFYTINNTTADAFLSGANPTLNYGSAGTLAIAPSSSSKGELDSVIKFNLGSAVSQFNTTYGAGNWQINGLTLKLASSFGTQGTQPPNTALFNPINTGNFAIQWLSYDNWTEGSGGGTGAANGAVSFNSISTLLSGTHDSLGTFTYTPPGINAYASYTLPLDSGLVADATAGGDVSLYFSAADNQVNYLFNSKSFGTAPPEFIIEAGIIPEPSTFALLTMSLGGLFFTRKAIRKS